MEASNRIILREFEVLRALDATDVPHPGTVAVCADADVVGANFYVMQRIDGFTPRDPLPPPFDTDREARRELGCELVDGLAALANVDWRAVGLESFGKPDGFLERQVSRWRGMLESYKVRDIEGIDTVSAWLESNRPQMSTPGIMHGDYQFVNVMFADGAPARLAAIVDWEQSTIGDPLLDLGWLLAGWSDPGEPLPFTAYLSQRDGLPTRAELVERYARATGRDVERLEYYVVLACFKLACVLEGAYARYVTGKSTSEMHRQVGDTVVRLIDDARAIVGGERKVLA
jgi:aminoglycoside phosphotransferase (APT) family kinase protein